MTIATTPPSSPLGAEPTATPPPPTSTTPPGPQFVFAIFGADVSEKIGELVRAIYLPDDFYELPSGDWLVADRIKQPSKVYDKIMGENPHQISIIVAKVDRVYGLHDVAVWDWIESKKNGDT